MSGSTQVCEMVIFNVAHYQYLIFKSVIMLGHVFVFHDS